MKTILSVVTALSGATLAGSTFDRIERGINANVCDNWQWVGDDVDGEDFDVVGPDDYTMGRGPSQGRGPGGGRGGGGRGGGGGQRGGGQRGGQHAPMQLRGGPPNMPANVPNPGWMKNSNPYGISAPIEGLIQLPLRPQDAAGTGTFTSTVTNIGFLGRTQRPFRGERVVATITRIGTTAATPTVRTVNGIVVGVVPQQAQLGNTNVSEWAATSFGVRMAMNVAYPGNDITSTLFLVGALTAPDTIVLDLTIYGRYVG